MARVHRAATSRQIRRGVHKARGEHLFFFSNGLPILHTKLFMFLFQARLLSESQRVAEELAEDEYVYLSNRRSRVEHIADATDGVMASAIEYEEKAETELARREASMDRMVFANADEIGELLFTLSYAQLEILTSCFVYYRRVFNRDWRQRPSGGVASRDQGANAQSLYS